MMYLQCKLLHNFEQVHICLDLSVMKMEVQFILMTCYERLDAFNAGIRKMSV